MQSVKLELHWKRLIECCSLVPAELYALQFIYQPLKYLSPPSFSNMSFPFVQMVVVEHKGLSYQEISKNI